MEIIAHRGYWKRPCEKNSEIAFSRANLKGFGIETDLRWANGSVIISHDLVQDEVMTLDEFFVLWKKRGQAETSSLALNIKSCGMVSVIYDSIKKNTLENYFVFDASVPDLIQYFQRGMWFFTRQSEYEKCPVLLHEAQGIWMDEFLGHWITDEILLRYLDMGKAVCIVSPELHGRSHAAEWKHYKKFIDKYDSGLIALCTDYPEHARRFFYGQ